MKARVIHFWWYEKLGPRFYCGASTKGAQRCCYTDIVKLITCKRCKVNILKRR
jgi:hypothetical protein